MVEIGDTQFRIGLALAPHTKFPASLRWPTSAVPVAAMQIGNSASVPGTKVHRRRSKAAEPKPGGFLFLVGKPECRQLGRDGPTRLRRFGLGSRGESRNAIPG